ncbi:MAG: hypothetical protein MI923_08020 [Phycisphaerales bacterium]|nr:hypothetical protein [Phycisphaerales bacterium]
MESVIITLPRRRSILNGYAFEVFGDNATGTIDSQHPLTDHPIPFWGGIPCSQGHLYDGHLAGIHVDHVIPDGHFSGRHLNAEHLWPATEVLFKTRPLYFGAFRFAAATMDQYGNKNTTLTETAQRVVNSSPRPASALERATFDPLERRMSFTFTPSPDLSSI